MNFLFTQGNLRCQQPLPARPGAPSVLRTYLDIPVAPVAGLGQADAWSCPTLPHDSTSVNGGLSAQWPWGQTAQDGTVAPPPTGWGLGQPAPPLCLSLLVCEVERWHVCFLGRTGGQRCGVWTVRTGLRRGHHLADPSSWGQLSGPGTGEAAAPNLLGPERRRRLRSGGAETGEQAGTRPEGRARQPVLVPCHRAGSFCAPPEGTAVRKACFWRILTDSGGRESMTPKWPGPTGPHSCWVWEEAARAT